MRLIGAIALVLVLAPSAGAAEVARDGAITLDAEQRRGELCLTVLHRERQFAQTCSSPHPRTAFRAVELAGPDDSFGIAVAPHVAEVGVAGRRYTTAAAEGFGARFTIVRARPPHILRLFDAEGALIGAAESVDELRTHRRTIGRVGGARVLAYRARGLRPDPLELDRVVGSACVELVRRGSAWVTCMDSGSGSVVTELLPACRSQPGVLGGLVPAAADSVVVVLGSGRRLHARARTLPPGSGAAAFAVPVPAGQAIRSVTADGEQGEVVATAAIRRPPVRQDCPSFAVGGSQTAYADASDFAGQAPAGPAQTAMSDTGHELFVADSRAARGLCLGVDVLRRSACRPITPDPALTSVVRYGEAVAGVFGTEVARVDLRLVDGSVLRVATSDGPGYTGRYTGRVRFMLAVVTPGTVRRAVLRDAAGRRLATTPVLVDERPGVLRRRTLAGVRVTALRLPPFIDTSSRSRVCARVAGAAFGGLGNFSAGVLCEDYARLAPSLFVVRCGKPRAVLAGVARPGRVPRVVLADGRVIRPLVAKLGRARVWIARPPRLAAVRKPVRLPPRSRQCGYVGFPEL